MTSSASIGWSDIPDKYEGPRLRNTDLSGLELTIRFSGPGLTTKSSIRKSIIFLFVNTYKHVLKNIVLN